LPAANACCSSSLLGAAAGAALPLPLALVLALAPPSGRCCQEMA
jgi:hypothetical protein